MIKFICDKCKKEFYSKFNLERHHNRKTPCFISETTCTRCLQEFKSVYLLEKHMKKKIPCKSYKKRDKNLQLDSASSNKNNTKVQIKLEIEKEKTIQKEIDAKKEEMRMQHEKEMKLLDLEILKLRTEKNLEIENKKTERKEKTAHVINNIETINIQNNFIQHIENKYIVDNMHTIDSPHFRSENNLKKIFNKYITNSEFNCYLYSLCKTAEEFTILFLRILFNNEALPKIKFMFYNKDLGNFYGIFKQLSNEENKKEVKQIEYEKYIDPILRPIVLELYRILEDYFVKSDNTPSTSDEDYHKFLDITQNRMEGLNQLKNMAKDILYENNIISKDEYMGLHINFNKLFDNT